MSFETRQAMTKYPVTLYATKSCPSCDQARQALRQRGVPFNEYSVTTESDYNAFQSRFGGSTFPVLAIGSQTIKGYSPLDLSGYLDAAGYPAQGRLAGYSWPAAAPLAPRSATPATASADADEPAPAASVPSKAPVVPPPTRTASSSDPDLARPPGRPACAPSRDPGASALRPSRTRAKYPCSHGDSLAAS